VSEWCNGRALPRDETVILAIQSLAAAAGAVSDGELVALYWAARGQLGSPRGQAPVPRELPTRLRRFTGRDAELAHLRRLLGDQTAGGSQIVVVHGLAGVGKSALALEAAWQLEDRFPDGQLYLELHGATAGLTPLDPGDALGRLLRSLGVDGAAIPAEPEEASARYRSLLAERQVLVVLDNAASAGQVRPLLPSSSGSAALVTSRNLLPDLDAHAIHLDVMAPSGRHPAARPDRRTAAGRRRPGGGEHRGALRIPAISPADRRRSPGRPTRVAPGRPGGSAPRWPSAAG
jgi:hypothetical protein